MPKKVSVVVLSLVLAAFMVATPVHAQTPTPAPCPPGMDTNVCDAIKSLFQSSPDGPWYNQNYNQFQKKIVDAPADEIFGERYTFAQINWIINSLAVMLNPASQLSDPNKLFQFIQALQGIKVQTMQGKAPTLAQYSQFGTAGYFAAGISAIYANPPASAIQQSKKLVSKIFDLGTGAQPVYAQGYGYIGLNAGGAVSMLWTASRNMAYLIIVILLVASGFLIMFRVKINPQTVVSLQTMIPKLIITLTLVTFSFAIAGLVIDLIYVFILATIGFMSLPPSQLIGNPGEAIKWLTTSDPTSYIALQSVGTIVIVLASVFASTIGGAAGGLAGGSVILPVIGSIGGLGGGILGGLLIGLIIGIVLSLLFIVTLIKIIFMMVKAYVMLILQIAIGPLQIMLDLIPGQQGFGPWIRNLIANASVFVVVPVMFLIQNIFTPSFLIPSMLGFQDPLNIKSPAGLSNLQLPIIGGGGAWNVILQMIVGFVIFTMTPKVADIIRDMLKVPAWKYGTGIGEAFGPLAWAYGYAANSGADERKFKMDQASKGPNANIKDYMKYAGTERNLQTGKDLLKSITGVK